MARQVIAPQTTAYTTSGLYFNRDKLPVNLVAIGLSSGEEIGIEISNDDGITFEQFRFGGADFKITYDTHTRMIQGPCVIRLVKGVTANPVSVGYSSGDEA